MRISTYHHPVLTYRVDAPSLMWVDWYVTTAIRQELEKGKEIKNPRSKARYLKANKLCCLAFAMVFGLMDQWGKRHEKLSTWPPDTDYSGHGHRLRIVGSPADEQWSFGPTLSGRVFENDYQRGHTGYVLAAWYPPIVDIVGWLPRDQLKPFVDRHWYNLQEPVVHPMSTLTGFERRWS